MLKTITSIPIERFLIKLFLLKSQILKESNNIKLNSNSKDYHSMKLLVSNMGSILVTLISSGLWTFYNTSKMIPFDHQFALTTTTSPQDEVVSKSHSFVSYSVQFYLRGILS